MKLQYQLNIAFTTLLIVIMSVTGYVIYSLILDLLIEDERRHLEQTGETLVSVLTDSYGTREEIQQTNEFLQDQDLHLFLYDRFQDTVLSSTMPDRIVDGFRQNNSFAENTENLWEFGNHNYVTSRIVFQPEGTGLELILLTPMNDLQAVQQDFVTRLLLVFLIGAIAAVLLSTFLTTKLVTPLTQLKWQLKKIEKRQFDDIERIKATGEIKEVEQSVYEMAEELRRYMHTQQTFFQNASHELKTPLMTIQGYAEGIRDHVFEEKDQEKGLEIMMAEVSRLKTIINEMILLAKLDSEPTAYESAEINIPILIDQVADRMLPLVSEKGIDFHQNVEVDSTLVADEEKLLRALLNLTINGIRHANSQVNLNVYKRNQMIVMTIEDDGEGIPEDLIPHIFHRFVKGKNGETGLGLAIARAIIEQSGGKIRLAKSEIGGAKFEVIFPD
ncbi:signal transduction histidine kinase [Virgibacillus natechei]|uniref:histidine kinase n=1 Tax=Virgibacillus natechei TaxID=1216297 RepID=A0ABS4ICI4_9BACI|nr:HAMP domain-containing sensor histidine kinase [Virgibacillus natechei]MBP1968623.1 signal transduction histidine kinase [Virgibacillus natechei]UZD13730.1 HAMP domain-containing histidine kinase [Virgibacillus natechei]